MLPPQTRTVLKGWKTPFILLAQWEIATFCSSSTHAFKQHKQLKGAFKQAFKDHITLWSQTRKA
jgi:hypothetical protein